MMDSVGLVHEKSCARVLVEVEALWALTHLHRTVWMEKRIPIVIWT